MLVSRIRASKTARPQATTMRRMKRVLVNTAMSGGFRWSGA
jgi:hypothetical protein